MTISNVVITGANSGIGFESALHFARGGANVVMACRSTDKAQVAQSQILAAVPAASTRVIRLDVADLQSVHEFKRQFEQEIGELDLLVNNAGIVAIPLARNSAGHELQLATNYLGAFALTGLLLPFFRKDTPARIVNVGSLAHRIGKLNIEDLNWERTDYDQWKAYANSKVAMLSFTLELNRRLGKTGSRVIALAAHPGFANTNIHRNSPALSRTNPVSKWFHSKMERFIPTAANAARPIILAAEGNGVEGGDYYGPGGFLEIGGKPSRARINPLAKDTDLGKRLWGVSESLTGVSYLPDDA
ncbi:MAG: oxidoreductase [Gammaproteobacteria bacterium]|nr:oxidoreductase [Gammaproteobacteria bacterium]